MFVVTTGARRLVARGTVVEIDLIGRDTVKSMPMAPFCCAGAYCPRVELMKRKLSGTGTQTNEVLSPVVPLTLSILSSNSVPDPSRGMELFEEADTRRVLIVPGPVLRMVAETVQLVAVSPAACTNGGEKLTTAES